jgi:peroxiredoxin
LPSHIETLYREFQGQGLSVWAINMQEGRDYVAGWIRTRGLTMPVLLDLDGAATRAYRVTATPTVVLVDRAGKLVGRAVGARSWDSPTGRALVRALLQARRPTG